MTLEVLVDLDCGFLVFWENTVKENAVVNIIKIDIVNFFMGYYLFDLLKNIKLLDTFSGEIVPENM
jgi:hypothetical protein